MVTSVKWHIYTKKEVLRNNIDNWRQFICGRWNNLITVSWGCYHIINNTSTNKLHAHTHMHTDIFLRIICQSVDAHAILVSTIPLPFCSCRFAVAVTKIPQELRKRRKHYVAYAKKNPLRRCRFHLPLCRNCRSVAIGSNPFLPFCRWWTTNQRSGHFIPMYTERRFQHFRSHLQRQR